jgi:hypothetical protein
MEKGTDPDFHTLDPQLLVGNVFIENFNVNGIIILNDSI